MGVGGVRGHRALEVEVQALGGGSGGHRVDHRLRLRHRRAVLGRQPRGVVPGHRRLRRRRGDRGRVELEAAPDDLDLPATAAAALEGAEEVDADEVFVVKISAAYARDFVARAQALVSAGRPPCPFCLQPLDPAGHVCPRANGYRRPLF